MRRRTTSVLAVVVASILLAGCGGGGGKDKIKGADDNGHASSSPSTSASAHGVDRPKMPLPKDLHLVFDDWKAPESDEQAVLDDTANYVRSIAYGVVKQNTNSPAYLAYSVALSQAQSYAKDQIKQHVDAKYTITGTEHYYRPTVTKAESGGLVEVQFCNNEEKLYSKSVKTKKVYKTKPSLEDYNSYTVVMQKASHADLWQAKEADVKGKATQCR